MTPRPTARPRRRQRPSRISRSSSRLRGSRRWSPRAPPRSGPRVPPRRGDVVGMALSDPDAVRLEAPAQAWSDATDPTDARDVERRLVKSLRQPGDGYLARVDRRISIALSRLFIRTTITPNAITALSLV